MITRERLKELIKEGATIYRIKHCGGDVADVHLKNISDEFWYVLLGMTEELFENKAEAEEKSKKIKQALKYNSTWTDELNLPTWEEIVSRSCGKIFSRSFCCRNDYYITEYVLNVYTPLSIEIRKYDIDKNKNESICYRIFNKDFNKENYEKACELYVKLFKGGVLDD